MLIKCGQCIDVNVSCRDKHVERNFDSDLHLMEADLRIIVTWQKSYEYLQGETQGENKLVTVLMVIRL
jgi:hypothetical protein